FWVASLSWTMTHTRSRFQKAVKIRRAYFLARSALQHFFLKVKLLERLCPQAMQTLYQAQGPQRTILSNSFLEDVVSPSEIGGSYPGKYSISAFSIGSISREKLEMSVEIKAKGVIDGESETIQRVYKVNR
ncbi:hypothetical protein HYY75_00395, partial [bacterium]|nr:hypothetical protein [bacterium]